MEYLWIDIVDIGNSHAQQLLAQAGRLPRHIGSAHALFHHWNMTVGCQALSVQSKVQHRLYISGPRCDVHVYR